MHKDARVEEAYFIRDFPHIKYCSRDYEKIKQENRNQFEKRTAEWHIFSSTAKEDWELECLKCGKRLMETQRTWETGKHCCGTCIVAYMRMGKYFDHKFDNNEDVEVEIKE